MSGDENFLSRWSRRKTEAKAPERGESATPVVSVTLPSDAPAVPPSAERQPLPPVESLDAESDFAPFMAPEVDGDVRRQALKTLFSDPRYNVMDMMDVYVDDYSKPDPLPESWLAKMEQVSRLGDRAGRDREEAERLRAQAEGPIEEGESHPVAEQDPARIGEEESFPEAAAGPEGKGDAPGAGKPSQVMGESGT